MDTKPRIIAFYLPQYHPFKENDEWWGKGFTEWTNVVKAKPLFKGHQQPNIPADLGFYDLRLPEVREEQAKLAMEAGIEGFCYWHYWFNGHELMERPFWEVVKSGSPDYPFCIGWANETWKSKMWNKDGSLAPGTKVLIEQTYSEADDVLHFNKLLEVFKDKRYIKVDGAPLVFIHRGSDLPAHTIRVWNQLAKDAGFSGIHFVGRITPSEPVNATQEALLKKGYNAVTITRRGQTLGKQSFFHKIARIITQIIRYNGCHQVVDYKEEAKVMIDPVIDAQENVYPEIYPNWDHSPRSGKSALIFVGSTPQLFGELINKAIDTVSKKEKEHQIIFVKSWNEWGEGNYLEPDLVNGKGYLNTIKDSVNS